MVDTEVFRISPGSSVVVELDETTNTLTVGFIATALVTITLLDALTGVIVLAATPMVYVTGSRGLYRVTLPSSLMLTVGQRLTAVCIIIDGGVRRELWRPVVVVSPMD